jgi:para-nitrobenzyl esterase
MKCIFISCLMLFNAQALTVNAQRSTPSTAEASAKAVNAKPVLTESGLVRGYYNERSGITIYKGIPFAAAPVGDLRWKAPQPAVHWKGIKECVAFGPSPMQAKPISFLMIGPEFVVPAQPLS